MSDSKATITHVGTSERDERGDWRVEHWSMDCRGEVPAMELDPKVGVRRFGGWTPEELHEIAHGRASYDSGG